MVSGLGAQGCLMPPGVDRQGRDRGGGWGGWRGGGWRRRSSEQAATCAQPPGCAVGGWRVFAEIRLAGRWREGCS